MQRRFVWHSKGSYYREFLRFFVGTSGTFGLNIMLLTLFVEIFEFPINVSQTFLVLALTILGYLYQKHHVFVSAWG